MMKVAPPPRQLAGAERDRGRGRSNGSIPASDAMRSSAWPNAAFTRAVPRQRAPQRRGPGTDAALTTGQAVPAPHWPPSSGTVSASACTDREARRNRAGTENTAVGVLLDEHARVEPSPTANGEAHITIGTPAIVDITTSAGRTRGGRQPFGQEHRMRVHARSERSLDGAAEQQPYRAARITETEVDSTVAPSSGVATFGMDRRHESSRIRASG